MNIVQSPYATGAYGGFGGVYGRNPMSTGVPGLPAESYYADPNVGPIAQNIGTALFGNPQMMRQNELSAAQIAQENARTQGLNFANTQQQNAATARAGLGALWQHLSTVANPDGTSRAATPQEMIGNAGSLFQGAVNAYPDSPQAAGDAFRTFAGIQGNPQILSNAVAGAGGAYTSTPVGQKVAEAGSTGRTGIMAGAEITKERMANDAAMARQHDTQQFGVNNPAPMTVAPGATVLIPPNAKGYAGMGTPIPGAPVDNPVGTETGTAPSTAGPSMGSTFTAPQRPYTSDQARAQMETDRINAMPPGPAKDKAMREFVSPTVVNAETNVGGRVDVQNLKNAGKPDHPANAVNQGMVDAEVDSQLGSASFAVNSDAKNAIRARASELYGKGVGSPQAVEQAIREFGASNPPNAGYGYGNLFSPGTTRYGAPLSYGGAPQGGGIVPAQSAPTSPVPSQAAPGGLPAQPANVPPGSAYSPSHGMWRSPDGRIFDAQGRPAA